MQKRHRSIAVALALSSVLLGVSPAPAPDAGSSCGTNPQTPRWHSSMSCHFWFRGFPIIVRGDATAAEGKARVRVWVSTEHSDAVALVECSATDGDNDGFASCSNGIPDETTQWPWPTAAQFMLLYCHVEGVNRGTVLCSSGSGA